MYKNDILEERTGVLLPLWRRDLCWPPPCWEHHFRSLSASLVRFSLLLYFHVWASYFSLAVEGDWEMWVGASPLPALLRVFFPVCFAVVVSTLVFWLFLFFSFLSSFFIYFIFNSCFRSWGEKVQLFTFPSTVSCSFFFSLMLLLSLCYWPDCASVDVLFCRELFFIFFYPSSSLRVKRMCGGLPGAVSP